MSKSFVLVPLLLTVFATAPSAATCDLGSLNGTYAFDDLNVEWVATGAGQTTESHRGAFTFDGAGNYTAQVTERFVDENGTSTSTPVSLSGTYGVTADCRATVNLGPDASVDF